MDPAPPLTLNVIKEDGLIKQRSVGAKSFVIKISFPDLCRNFNRLHEV